MTRRDTAMRSKPAPSPTAPRPGLISVRLDDPRAYNSEGPATVVAVAPSVDEHAKLVKSRAGIRLWRGTAPVGARVKRVLLVVPADDDASGELS